MVFSDVVHEHRQKGVELSARPIPKKKPPPRRTNYVAIGAMTALIGGIVAWSHAKGGGKKPKDPRAAAAQAAIRRCEVRPSSLLILHSSLELRLGQERSRVWKLPSVGTIYCQRHQRGTFDVLQPKVVKKHTMMMELTVGCLEEGRFVYNHAVGCRSTSSFKACSRLRSAEGVIH